MKSKSGVIPALKGRVLGATKSKLGTRMLPIGPLMIEHRLIERMVRLLEKELEKIQAKNQVAMGFINSAIDFFKSYADRCHHGKEEDILFKQLQEKPLSLSDAQMLETLKQEHLRARALVARLSEDTGRGGCCRFNREILKSVALDIEELVKLYKEHIRKEDKQFFIPVMQYLNKREQDAMLCKFWEFDRTVIHQKYKELLAQFEGGAEK